MVLLMTTKGDQDDGDEYDDDSQTHRRLERAYSTVQSLQSCICVKFRRDYILCARASAFRRVETPFSNLPAYSTPTQSQIQRLNSRRQTRHTRKSAVIIRLDSINIYIIKMRNDGTTERCLLFGGESE